VSTIRLKYGNNALTLFGHSLYSLQDERERADLDVTSMARLKINYEQMPARFPSGTFDRMDAVLMNGESRAELIRVAVEHEIANRREARRRTSKSRQPSAHSSKRARATR
jgi:hypothetical protein